MNSPDDRATPPPPRPQGGSMRGVYVCVAMVVLGLAALWGMFAAVPEKPPAAATRPATTRAHTD